MKEEMYIDDEYESIRQIMRSRGQNAGQLPGRVVRFIPDSRADKILALDNRVEQMKRIAPFVGLALAFLLGWLL